MIPFGLLRRVSVVALAAASTQACVSISNYTDPGGPRYGSPLPSLAPVASEDADAPTGVSGVHQPRTVTIATFNVEHGRDIDGALAVLNGNADLRGADFILLQEMESEGTARIAAELGMDWVYYPASERDGRDFGNAVLSRWPILEDDKILLPHEAWIGGGRRTATAITAQVDDQPIRVYSVHLATPVNQSRADREDQLQAVLEDAASYGHVVIGGDLNSHSLPELAVEAGYAWPTESGPRTIWIARVDHILYRGLVPVWFSGSGTVEDNLGSSDHLPVWARGRIR